MLTPQLDACADAVALFLAVLDGDQDATAAIIHSQPGEDSGPVLTALCTWFAHVMIELGTDPIELAGAQLAHFREV